MITVNALRLFPVCFLALPLYCKSQDQFNNYDLQLAKTRFETEIIHGGYWEEFSTKNGRLYFSHRRDFQLHGSIRVVPVLIPVSPPSSNISIGDFQSDYSTFVAIIYRNKKLKDVMFITHAYDKQDQLIEVPSVGMKPKKIKYIFRKYANSVFYDDNATTFCRLEGNTVFAWDDSRGRFVDYFKYTNRAFSPAGKK